MKVASENREYERAASFLNRSAKSNMSPNPIPLLSQVNGKNSDALALYRQGEEVMLVQLLFREGNCRLGTLPVHQHPEDDTICSALSSSSNTDANKIPRKKSSSPPHWKMPTF